MSLVEMNEGFDIMLWSESNRFLNFKRFYPFPELSYERSLAQMRASSEKLHESRS